VLDPLGAACGARRIEHVRAGGLVGDRGGGHLVPGGFKALEGGPRLADHVEFHIGHEFGQFIGHWADAGRGDQHLRLTVMHDVFDLAGAELGRDAGEIEARPLGRPGDLEIAGIVVHHQGDDVADLQAKGPEELGALVGAVIQLGVGDRLAGPGHDIGGAIGVIEGVCGRMHGCS